MNRAGYRLDSYCLFRSDELLTSCLGSVTDLEVQIRERGLEDIENSIVMGIALLQLLCFVTNTSSSS